jgi:hypothetical protein
MKTAQSMPLLTATPLNGNEKCDKIGPCLSEIGYTQFLKR